MLNLGDLTERNHSEPYGLESKITRTNNYPIPKINIVIGHLFYFQKGKLIA